MGEDKIIIKHRFVPLRIPARSGKSIDMIFDIYNNTDKEVLLSFDFALPKKALVGFDSTASKKHYTAKVKKIPPYQTLSFYVTIYTTAQTPEGEYPILYRINYHVDNYDKVLHQKTNKAVFRIV